MTETKDITATIGSLDQQACHIQEANPSDFPIIMRIMKSSFSKTYGEGWNEHQCRSMLILAGTRTIIAKINGIFAGFAISRAVLDEEELLMIAVDPVFQKKGLGKSLLKHLLKNAAENGVSSVFLEVRSNNDAQLLYRRLGFKKMGLRAAYYTGENGMKFDAITYKISF